MRHHLISTAALLASACTAAATPMIPDPTDPAHCIAAHSYAIIESKGTELEQHPGFQELRVRAMFEMTKLKRDGAVDEGRRRGEALTKELSKSPDKFLQLGKNCIVNENSDPAWERMRPALEKVAMAN